MAIEIWGHLSGFLVRKISADEMRALKSFKTTSILLRILKIHISLRNSFEFSPKSYLMQPRPTQKRNNVSPTPQSSIQRIFFVILTHINSHKNDTWHIYVVLFILKHKNMFMYLNETTSKNYYRNVTNQNSNYEAIPESVFIIPGLNQKV